MMEHHENRLHYYIVVEQERYSNGLSYVEFRGRPELPGNTINELHLSVEASADRTQPLDGDAVV